MHVEFDDGRSIDGQECPPYFVSFSQRWIVSICGVVPPTAGISREFWAREIQWFRSASVSRTVCSRPASVTAPRPRANESLIPDDGGCFGRFVFSPDSPNVAFALSSKRVTGGMDPRVNRLARRTRDGQLGIVVWKAAEAKAEKKNTEANAA